MKEKAVLIEKVCKSIVEIILAAVCIISFILAIVSSLSFGSKTGFYIFALITALAIMGIYSVYVYKKETQGKCLRRKLQLVIRIIWNYTIMLSILMILYRIEFSEVAVQDKSYWIYDLMAYYAMFSISLKYIIKSIREGKRIIEEKEGILGHFFNILFTVWIIFFFNIFGFYLFYIPVKTMELDNAPKPYSLPISEYKYKGFGLFDSRFRNSVIDDEKLLEKFTDELSYATIKSMRGVEYLVEERRASNELYYRIMPQYKDSNGKDAERPYIFEKMYFSEMRLYRNGDLILENHISKAKFPFPNYRTELYKVTLSPELTNQIIGSLEAGWREKNK